MTASATPPPVDGPHWKPVAKVFEGFRERWDILAADKFNAQPWWYRWSTASGWPRRLSYAVLPPETPIKIDSDVLDPDCEDEIEIRLNGEACCGWLAVWDPPAAAEPSSPAATPKAKRQIKQANQPERLQRRLVNAGLDRLRSEYPAKYRKGFRKTSPAVLMRQMKPFWAKICEGESVSPADYPLDKMWDTVARAIGRRNDPRR